MKILLKGYYGFGNLGDDILMLTSCGICKKLFKQPQITVMTAGSDHYIRSFSKELVSEVVPIGPEPPADIVVYGGGGVFYDFRKGNIFYRLLNTTINFLGSQAWYRLLAFYRNLKGWSMNGQALRVGLGIGTGSFTPSSKKYYQKFWELAQFDWLFLRDVTSYESVKRLRLPAKLRPSTDLAFLKEYWMPKINTAKDPRSIGFILKYWPQHPEYLAICQKVAADLLEQGYKVTVFIFEQGHDNALADRFPGCRLQIWNPQKVSLETYLEALAAQSVVVTSRAHGAILAGAFRIPAICLGIEPKLKTIHSMFPLSAHYLDLPLTSEKVKESVEAALKISNSEVEKDFQWNHDLLTQSLDELKEAYHAYALA